MTSYSRFIILYVIVYLVHVWCVCLCVWSRDCSWRVLGGTERKCCSPSPFPRSSMTTCQSSGFAQARRKSLKHGRSISALCIRRVPDVAFWVRRDTPPTLCWCWTFRRNIRSVTGSTAEWLRCVSSTTDVTNLSLLSPSSDDFHRRQHYAVSSVCQ